MNNTTGKQKISNEILLTPHTPIHFIPYVNAPELLLKAAVSTASLASLSNCVIIDNRNDVSLPSPAQIVAGSAAEPVFSIYTPDVPLTTAQTMNLMLRLAGKNGSTFFTWIHGDGEIVDDGDPRVLWHKANSMVESKEKWGAIFTHYDVFCAFNVEACNAAGDWDWLRFPYYYLDNDYYHRLRVAGFPCIAIGGSYVRHNNDASNTIKNDKVRDEINRLLFPIQDVLFKRKYPDGVAA